MGYTDACAFLEQPDVELVAVCDIDKNIRESRIADLQKYAYGKKISVPKLDQYEDFRKVLERKDIDAIIIATPDHWHALITIMACEAGKDVYVEKPVANSIFEANQMVNAAKRYNRVVQVGQWQRSGLHWQEMVDYIQSDKLGTISQVDVWLYGGNPVPKVSDTMVPDGVNYDMWLGPAPLRSFNPNRFHYNFRWFWDYAGGKMTDWGVHLLDMALAGMKADFPKSAMSSGGKLAFTESPIDTPDTQQVIYEFDGFNVIWDHAMGIGMGDWGRDHGVAFIGNNGTLVADRNGWEVHPEKSDNGPLLEEVARIKGTGKGLDLNVENFIQCIKTNNRETNASPTIGRAVATMAHMGNIAIRTGKKIYWDPTTASFVNDADSNALIKPVYRAPWSLTDL
jgi:predicted dehydrogenase